MGEDKSSETMSFLFEFWFFFLSFLRIFPIFSAKTLDFLENGIIFSLKLKRKTQNSRKKLKTQGKNSMSRRTCPLPPSQVMLKKSLLIDLNKKISNFFCLKICPCSKNQVSRHFVTYLSVSGSCPWRMCKWILPPRRIFPWWPCETWRTFPRPKGGRGLWGSEMQHRNEGQRGLLPKLASCLFKR